ncbi:hypothetical protein [Paenibacillus sp. MBLB4367]|uniref:hypothetical protein n=1 Tax=Paenibacillus sp. MBLB4367 TaxID=3384767 RepID=UPI0039083314
MKMKVVMSMCVTVLFTLFLTQVVTVADAPAQPGTSNDPLVTKSYVDELVQKKVAEEVAKMKDGTPATPTPAPNASESVTVVELKANQTLLAAAGAEFIVRTGKTLIVSSDENGVPDVTTGKDIAPNGIIETNHLLIFPREGRGIKPDPKNKDAIFVMVKGNYILQNADGTKVTP